MKVIIEYLDQLTQKWCPVLKISYKDLAKTTDGIRFYLPASAKQTRAKLES